MHRRTNSIPAILAALLIIPVPAILTGAEQPPLVQWITMGTRDGGTDAALSPSGELFVAGMVDHQPGGGPTQVLLRFDREGRISTNRLVAVTGAKTTFDVVGNRYLTGNFDTNGYYTGFVTATNYLFDPSQVHGLFLAKYNPGGQLLWVRSQALADNATVRNRGSAIAIDGEGNILVGGVSEGPMTLGNVQFGDGGGPLICKYDRDGQLLWARRVEHQSYVQYPQAYLYQLCVDLTGHIVICGFLSEGTADFGGRIVLPGSTDLAYGGDWFLARYKPNGDLDWVKLGYADSLAVAKNGDIYATFAWPKDPIVGNGLAKFNSSGNLLWSKSFPGGYVEYVALDPKDEPVLSGGFSGTIQLDGIRLVSRTPSWEDILLLQTDADGHVRWAISGGGSELDSGGRVLCDAQSNIFLTGVARKSNGSFDGLPLTPIPPPADNVFSTLFVAKLNPAPHLKINLTAGAPVLSWPARATNHVLEAVSILPAIDWKVVTNTPTVVGRDRQVQLPITDPARFFRLRKL